MLSAGAQEAAPSLLGEDVEGTEDSDGVRGEWMRAG